MTGSGSPGSRDSARAGGGNPLPVRVAVVDDHGLVRETLHRLLLGVPDMEWVGEAQDGAEAVDLVARTRPDIVLMDLSMPGTDGLAATEAIVSTCAPPRVLVLTSATDTHHLTRSLDAGASAVLPKDGNPETILAGIRSVARGPVTGMPSRQDS